jgi:hypothetical protein
MLSQGLEMSRVYSSTPKVTKDEVVINFYKTAYLLLYFTSLKTSNRIVSHLRRLSHEIIKHNWQTRSFPPQNPFMQ